MRTAASWVGAPDLVGTRAACGPGHNVPKLEPLSPVSQVARVTYAPTLRGQAGATAGDEHG